MSAATAHAVAAAHAGHHGDHHAPAVDNYKEQLRNNRLGLWLFFISETFLFGGLLAVRFFLWGDHRPELDQFIGLLVTSVLLLSSFTMNLAEKGMEHGDMKTFSRGLLATAVLGTIFLLGVLVFEWGLFPAIYQGHLTPWDNVYGAVVFAMTGMHALHVLSGIVFIFIVWRLGRQGHYTPQRHWGVEACAIYWHFVDLVWIFFYPALYLIGTPVH